MRMHALVSMRSRETPSWQGVQGCPELAPRLVGEFKAWDSNSKKNEDAGAE